MPENRKGLNSGCHWIVNTIMVKNNLLGRVKSAARTVVLMAGGLMGAASGSGCEGELAYTNFNGRGFVPAGATHMNAGGVYLKQLPDGKFSFFQQNGFWSLNSIAYAPEVSQNFCDPNGVPVRRAVAPAKTRSSLEVESYLKMKAELE